MDEVATHLKRRRNVDLVTSYGIFPPGVQLWEEVVRQIKSADLGVFDISENNPNVLMELGMATGFGKQTYVLKSRESEGQHSRPSDLAAVFIPYDDRKDLASQRTMREISNGIIAYLGRAHVSDYYFRSLWGFDESDTITVICSEVPDPVKRMYPEPMEFLYLNKYGDLDALLETVSTLRRLYPNASVEYYTANEILDPRTQYGRNLVIVGGPDYNPLAATFSHLSPFKYRSGKDDHDIRIKDRRDGKEYIPRFTKKGGLGQIKDYGFFLKRRNPDNPAKKIIMIGGPHTYGVYGAVKAFSYSGISSDEVARRNCKTVVQELGHDPEFCALFKVHGLQSSVQTPHVQANLLWGLGGKRRFITPSRIEHF
jgi:hypothetical protein